AGAGVVCVPTHTLCGLFVRPAFRRRGFGRQLLAHLTGDGPPLSAQWNDSSTGRGFAAALGLLLPREVPDACTIPSPSPATERRRVTVQLPAAWQSGGLCVEI